MDLISRKEVDEILLKFLEGCLEEKEYGESSLMIQVMKEIQNLENKNTPSYPIYREKNGTHDDWWKNTPIINLSDSITYTGDKQVRDMKLKNDPINNLTENFNPKE